MLRAAVDRLEPGSLFSNIYVINLVNLQQFGNRQGKPWFLADFRLSFKQNREMGREDRSPGRAARRPELAHPGEEVVARFWSLLVVPGVVHFCEVRITVAAGIARQTAYPWRACLFPGHTRLGAKRSPPAGSSLPLGWRTKSKNRRRARRPAPPG